MDRNITYALIHSPLVGPLTWELVCREMEKRGIAATVPALSDHPNSTQPFWQQHAESLARSLAGIPQDQRLVLVAHSGAGPLLPSYASPSLIRLKTTCLWMRASLATTQAALT